MEIVSPRICRLLSVVVDVEAITLWPFIFFRVAPNAVTRNHERIHLRQQLELLILGFYIVYVGEWAYKSLRTKSGVTAYTNSIFEREAYAHETDLNYLATRKPYAWVAKHDQ